MGFKIIMYEKGLNYKNVTQFTTGRPRWKVKKSIRVEGNSARPSKTFFVFSKIEKTVKFFTIEKKLNTLFADKLF